YGPGFGSENVNGTGVFGHVVDKTHIYVGANMSTPVTGLTLGAAWDTVNNDDLAATTKGVASLEGYASTLAGYLHYQATDKLAFNTRLEYAHGSAFNTLFAESPAYLLANGVPQEAKAIAVTETVQYQLWDNVLSRIEVRWDHSADGSPHFGGTGPFPTGAFAPPTKNNDITIAANIVYKF
ncbi:MAG: outer membrane beta-barrel protein, partial [Verrucomicrobiota bacterium]